MNDSIIEKTRAERESAIERILARRNNSLIQEGVAAYERERRVLLEQGREYHLAAYRGRDRLAIEPTYDLLQRKLKRLKVTDKENLFIVDVTPEEGEGLGR